MWLEEELGPPANPPVTRRLDMTELDGLAAAVDYSTLQHVT